jgi:hypothetical protein
MGMQSCAIVSEIEILEVRRLTICQMSSVEDAVHGQR